MSYATLERSGAVSPPPIRGVRARTEHVRELRRRLEGVLAERTPPGYTHVPGFTAMVVAEVNDFFDAGERYIVEGGADILGLLEFRARCVIGSWGTACEYARLSLDD
jgi:hypothetical protein